MKSHKKEIITVAILMAAAVVIFAGILKPEATQTKKCSLIYIPKIRDNTNDFWTSVISGCKMAAEEYESDLEILAPDKEENIEEQNKLLKKAIEQNHLILAYPGLSYRDDQRYALLLLNSILGGGCSSRLFQELREKRGLCYTVYSYVADHADTGLLGIYTATGSEQEAQALDAVRNIVSDLAEHGPTQEELDRAREQAQAGLLMGLESVQSRMSHLGASGLLYGRVREVDELLECYEQVTRQELRQLAQHLFRPQGASLSAVGRVRAAEEYAGWLAH